MSSQQKVRQEAASWRRSSARSLFSQRKLRQEPLQGSLLENCRRQMLPEFSCFSFFFLPICLEKIKSRRKLPSQNLGRKGSRKSSNQLAWRRPDAKVLAIQVFFWLWPTHQDPWGQVAGRFRAPTFVQASISFVSSYLVEQRWSPGTAKSQGKLHSQKVSREHGRKGLGQLDWWFQHLNLFFDGKPYFVSGALKC